MGIHVPGKAVFVLKRALDFYATGPIDLRECISKFHHTIPLDGDRRRAPLIMTSQYGRRTTQVLTSGLVSLRKRREITAHFISNLQFSKSRHDISSYTRDFIIVGYSLYLINLHS